MKAKKRYNTKTLTPEQVHAIQEQVYELAETIVSANYFVVDVEMVQENGRWYLRIYLDHPNPAVRITLDDCKDISEALEPMIDENVKELEDFSYNLEVSSPGLFRKLTKPREIQFYKGRRVELKLKGAAPFTAYISSYNPETREIGYQLSSEEDSELQQAHWDPKKLEISLSPDLSQTIETQTVPRRITRYD
jgi:ribosome maturation factor RimP